MSELTKKRITLKEAAERLGYADISKYNLLMKLKENKVKMFKPGKSYLIDVDSLEQFIQSTEV